MKWTVKDILVCWLVVTVGSAGATAAFVLIAYGNWLLFQVHPVAGVLGLFATAGAGFVPLVMLES